MTLAARNNFIRIATLMILILSVVCIAAFIIMLVRGTIPSIPDQARPLGILATIPFMPHSPVAALAAISFLPLLSLTGLIYIMFAFEKTQTTEITFSLQRVVDEYRIHPCSGFPDFAFLPAFYCVMSAFKYPFYYGRNDTTDWSGHFSYRVFLIFFGQCGSLQYIQPDDNMGCPAGLFRDAVPVSGDTWFARSNFLPCPGTYQKRPGVFTGGMGHSPASYRIRITDCL
jgi:hypothetical protein